MHPYYGERLLQFSNSIDIVDEATFKSVASLVQSYVDKILDIKDVSIFIDDPIGDEIGLRKLFTNRGTNPIRNSDGEYVGQTSFVYELEKPVWIVSDTENELLSESSLYLDKWSGEENIPTYLKDSFEDARTSIILPIKLNGKVIGVVNFESDCYLETTAEAKAELGVICNAISQLYKSSQFSRSISDNTENAITDLGAWLNENSVPKLTKPKIFVASSENAEKDVMKVVLDEIGKREDVVDLIYWKDLNDAGNISAQIFEAISSCRFAVCYLSEKTGNDGEFKYRDNSNVVFEAGMFHGRTKFITKEISNWLPIRERDSSKAPMDFSSERMIFPPRNDKGKLEESDFRESFSKRIEALINS